VGVVSYNIILGARLMFEKFPSVILLEIDNFTCIQGEQIGRNFVCWAIVFYGQSFNYISSPILGYFLHGLSYVLILTKIVLATFWAISLQSHLVTLLAIEKFQAKLFNNV
jgi:hypothetical protein